MGRIIDLEYKISCTECNETFMKNSQPDIIEKLIEETPCPTCGRKTLKFKENQ